MAELRWIMMSSLVMLQVLSCTVTSVEVSYFTVRDGNEVTFPCESVIHQKKCDGTVWLFSSGSTTVVTLFELGKIKKGDKVRSDRLNVTEECSLVIKKVKGQDAGVYTCRQFESRIGPQVGKDVIHHLSVDTSPSATKTTNKPPVTETPEKKTTTSPPEDKEPVDPGDDATKKTTKEEGASATKTTNKPPVTETPETKTTTSPPEDQKPVNPVLRTFVVCLGLAALLISLVTVNIWTRTKGKETRMEEIMQLDEVVEEDDSVNYENDGEPSASVSLD